MLLRKCLPDLAAAEIKTEQTHRYVIEPGAQHEQRRMGSGSDSSRRERQVPHNGV
jgi:hypothetical protein